MISYSEGLAKILSYAKQFSFESVPLKLSNNRVLAEEVRADRDYPPFNRSAMDGFTISSSDYSENKIYHYRRELPAGSSFQLEKGEEAIRIMTGAPVPIGLDVVIKIEDSLLSEEDNNGKRVSFSLESVRPWQNIAKKGEDLHEGDTVLLPGHTLGTSEISMLASLGKSFVSVAVLPKVQIISTGNEILSIDQTPLDWQIRDSNSYTISSILSKYKIIPESVKNIPDEETLLTEAIAKGLESDILILSGGVSMGSLDLVPSILQKLGVGLVFHKVQIKPGKPIWFGKRGNTIVFGMPGNPFSVQTCSRIFLEPFLRASMGQKQNPVMRLPISGTRNKKGSFTEFFPVRLDTKDKTYLSTVPFNGSGDIRAGLFSDGLAVHPSDSVQIREGDWVEFLPW
ncbi:molybdopterin molybdotransferase MoeA [Leptospira ilyithenensis]|uniref:Molybdopterin molybdenumtransferase n=1 Tax=Leptospira ilyithenensis TaxID=2484901 RepID=A0A4R9LNP1_9LEPT|nr:molybdopterin molybdotransferase MoeA [Leptospira ilyithenensis]TGN08503.1 molybdopterin molybdenumtransferase MoeA [Leptospira ilyithenensis]